MSLQDTDVRIVIPARYQSTRFPGKPLVDLAGKTMIQRVYEQALATGLAPDKILVATDDERIANEASRFGAQVQMTSLEHESGTDRLAEVARLNGWGEQTIVVNLQGDEPLMPAVYMSCVAESLIEHQDAGIATIAVPITLKGDVFDPNVVKVVCSSQGYAHYFSRAPIPWVRGSFSDSESSLPKNVPFYRHIGLYAYRVGTLRAFSNMQPTSSEQAESLEQLRALDHGVRIHVSIVDSHPGHGIDSPEDVVKVLAQLQG